MKTKYINCAATETAASTTASDSDSISVSVSVSSSGLALASASTSSSTSTTTSSSDSNLALTLPSTSALTSTSTSISTSISSTACSSTSVAGNVTGIGGASEKMKSIILYPYGPLTATGCCRMLHAKNLAITSAIYTINISLLIVLIYSWRINVNIRKSDDLEDVYYGVQIAYFAIIGTQMSMIVLSVLLIFGIYKENPGLIVPWIIGYITFMALEAVAMVYSNVLRDHVNKQFDAMCKAEVSFFIARAFINVLAMWGVLRFYNLVRSGITWKGPEAKTTLTTSTTRLASRSEGSSSSAEYRRSGGSSARYCPRHHRHRRENCMERKAASCCAFLDFDAYEDEDDDDDSVYGDYDDYYYDGDDCDEVVHDCYCSNDIDFEAGRTNCDYNDIDEDDEDDDHDHDDEDGSDCAMLGRRSVSVRRPRHCILTSTSSKRSHDRRRNRQRCNNSGKNNIRTVLINKKQHKYKLAQPQQRLEVINESERSAGSGSDENDSLLAAYDSSSSLASV